MGFVKYVNAKGILPDNLVEGIEFKVGQYLDQYTKLWPFSGIVTMSKCTE